MRRALALAALSGGFLLAVVACTDIFHDTSFETCRDASCRSDAADVVTPVTDATTPLVNFCAWDSTEARSRAIRACAWLGACEGPLGESAFGLCVPRAQYAFDCTANPGMRPRADVEAFWSCLASAQTCGDVDACVFPGGVPDCHAVDAKTVSTCGEGKNGAVRFACTGASGSARATGVEPCLLSGRTCSPNQLTAACTGRKGFGDCPVSQCEGSSAVVCDLAAAGTVDHGLDCASVGAGRCLAIDGGGACAPSDDQPECDDSSDAGSVCGDSGVLSFCVGKKKSQLNCSAFQLACTPGSLVAADPITACDDHTCTDTTDACIGNTLISCGHGKAVELDCSSVGLGACRKLQNNRAACEPPAR